MKLMNDGKRNRRMRLIDADALMERMYHDAFETDTDMQKWDSGCWIRYKMFENAIDEAPTIDAVSVWIPCSDRLPSEDGRYLVSYWLMKGMPWISVMYYGKPTFLETGHPCFYVSDDEYGDVVYDDIVAWMPLPKPYGERESE